MEKKGFTLTELLAVIVILGVITLIAIPSSFAISNRVKINFYCTKMDTIKKAADLYASDHFDEVKLGIINKVSIKDLVNYGYIKKDSNAKGNVLVVDPRDNETPLDDMTISLTINNNRPKTNFDQENYYYLCGDEKLKDKKDPNCLYKGESKTWTKSNRTITISCYDAGSGCKTKDEVKTYSSTKKTDTVNLTVRDWSGNSFRCDKTINVYVDKTKPTYEIVGAATDNHDWSNKRTITVKCKDSHSGCKTADQKFEYGILASDVNKRNVNTDTITFTVEDKAGNKQTYTEEVNVYTDVDNPTCAYYGEATTWTNEDRDVQILCEDSLSGCKATSLSIAIGTSSGMVEVPFIAEDNAGNQTNCTRFLEVFVDKVKPTIGTASFSGGKVTINVSDDQALERYEIFNSSNTKEASGNLEGTSQTVTFNKSKSGKYTIKVYDKAGNVQSKEFTIPQYTVTFALNNADYGTVEASSKKVDYNGSTSTTFTPATGYHYASVSGTGCTVSGTTVTASNVTSNRTCTITLEINTYTVTFKSSNTSMGTVATSTVTVNHGSSGSTTISPKTGYHYASVSGTGCSVSGTTVTASNVTSNRTCTVTFAINTYTVTFKSNNTSYGTVTDASKTVDHGSSASTTFAAKTNYHYASVSGTGCSVSDNTVTASNVTGNVTCTVNFAIDTRTVTFKTNDTSMGTVTDSSKTVNYNSSVSTTFTPATGYHYVSVSGTGCSVSGTTVTASNVTSNITCTVTFAINSYTVTFKSNDTTMGTVADASKTVNHGGSASTTISPKTNYRYASVSGTGCSVSGTTVTASNVSGNVTCTVTFALNQYTVTFKSNNTSYGTVTDASKTVTHGGSASTTFSPKTNYHYASVSGSGCTVSGTTVSVSNVTSNVTCTVNFAIDTHTVTFKSNNTNYGTVASGSATVNHGASASTTFSAKTNYHYASVSGTGCSVSGTTVTASNVTGNVTCTVNFAIDTRTITFKTNNTNMCTVADSSKTVNYNSSGSTTLTAKTGYHYASVSGTGCSVSGTTVTASNVTSNVTCTVTCAINTYTVTFKSNNTAMGTVASGSQTANYNGSASTTFTAKNGYNYNGVSGTGCSVSGNTVTASSVTSNRTCTVNFADKTAPTVPTTLQLYNPVVNSSSATYSVKVAGSSDVSTITYQAYINGAWTNCSSGVCNGSLANSSTSYTIYARACDAGGYCSANASRNIWLTPKRLYIWQVYQYMRSNAGSTIIGQPSEDEITFHSNNSKTAAAAYGMFTSTEANNYFNAQGVGQTVKNMYKGLLGRNYDQGGYDSNVAHINQNGRASAIKNMLNSSEAQGQVYGKWGLATGTI